MSAVEADALWATWIARNPGDAAGYAEHGDGYRRAIEGTSLYASFRLGQAIRKALSAMPLLRPTYAVPDETPNSLVEALEALPQGAVVYDWEGERWKRGATGWHCLPLQRSAGWPSSGLALREPIGLEYLPAEDDCIVCQTHGHTESPPEHIYSQPQATPGGRAMNAVKYHLKEAKRLKKLQKVAASLMPGDSVSVEVEGIPGKHQTSAIISGDVWSDYEGGMFVGSTRIVTLYPSGPQHDAHREPSSRVRQFITHTPHA